MATYQELFDIGSSDPANPEVQALHEKVTVACAIAAEAIRNEATSVPNHANRLIWAKQALAAPGQKKDEMLYALLAANSAATHAAIVGASDATVQTAVNNAVDLFADGTE